MDEKPIEEENAGVAAAIPAQRVMEFVGESDEDLGLDARLFNTFRVGKKWADIEEGDLISMLLVDGDRREWVGDAVVLAMDEGNLDNMLDKHAGMNHATRSLRYAASQRTALALALTRAYGRRLTSDDVGVVVYLWRID